MDKRKPMFITTLLSKISRLSLWLLLPAVLANHAAMAQDGERWFQIEVSIFTNESLLDRDNEQWTASTLSYPDKLRRLSQLSDLLLVDELKINQLKIDEPKIDDLGIVDFDTGITAAEITAEEEPATPSIEELILAVGPKQDKPASNFKFYDFQRDPYLQLSPDESDFQQTNRAIERSADHRLLFQGLWRQPVFNEDQAIPLYIEAGLRYGEQHELQGSITIRFNANRDRVVIDADLWLTEYSAAADPDSEWVLPSIPEQFQSEVEADQIPVDLLYSINRVFHLQQSRDMRSTEFHYIDHPALGLVVLVLPYEVPAIPAPEFDFEEAP